MEQVKKLCKEQNRGRLKSVFRSIAAFFVIMGIISIFYGSPFPYKEQRILGQAMYSGWIIEKEYLLDISLFLSVIIGVGITNIKIMYRFYELDYELLYNCDVERYLETMRFAVAYGKKFRFKGYQKTVFTIMQQRYIRALIIKHNFHEAEMYLSTKWVGDKNISLCRQCMMNLRLTIYYQNKETEKFNQLYEQASTVFRKDKFFQAYSLILNEKFPEAVELLSRYKTKILYNEVKRNDLLGMCYAALGDMQSAKKCMEYVAKNGNTMPCKSQAEEWLLIRSERYIGE